MSTQSTRASTIDQARLEALFLEAECHEEKGDLKKAFSCLLTAAKAEHGSSQLNLGNFYSDGKGTKKDLKQAAHWYQKAFRNGDSCGALNLAIDLRAQGRMKAAVIWFNKAIHLQDGSAMLQLAKLYISTKGGHKKAADLLRRALPLNCAQISDDEREEAAALLTTLDARYSVHALGPGAANR